MARRKKISTGYIGKITNTKTDNIVYDGKSGCATERWAVSPWESKDERIRWGEKFIRDTAQIITPEIITYSLIRVETFKQGIEVWNEYIDE